MRRLRLLKAPEWLTSQSRISYPSPGWLLQDLIWPHHLIVFMLKDMAVPDIPARVALEKHNNARDHFRVRNNLILPADVVAIGGHDRPGITNPAGGEIERFVEAAPIEDLEAHQMKVNRMRVLGCI